MLIAVDEKNQEKMVFITKYGLYDCICMPFGLCNAPHFRGPMELVLHGLQWETLLIYLEDIIILGRGVDESLELLADVFQLLQLRSEAEAIQVSPAQVRIPVLKA